MAGPTMLNWCSDFLHRRARATSIHARTAARRAISSKALSQIAGPAQRKLGYGRLDLGSWEPRMQKKSKIHVHPSK